MRDRYYPRYLGVAAPKGEAVYEFLVAGKDEIGALGQVASAFASHRVKLVSVGTYQMDPADGFVFNMYADFVEADCTPDQLTADLKAIPVVRTVESENVSAALFDRFLFPVMTATDARAVLIDAYALVTVETHFSNFLGQQGKQLLFESGRQGGLELARQTRGRGPKSASKDHLVNVQDGLRSAGWGIFAFDASAVEDGTVDVTVLRPVFSELDKIKESWYTFGIAAGVAEGIFGNPMVVTSSTYKRDAKELTFKLQEQAQGEALKALR